MITPLIVGPVATKIAPTWFCFPQAYADAGYCRKQRRGDECAPPPGAMQTARQLLEA